MPSFSASSSMSTSDGKFRLGSAVAAEGRAPAVVGAHGAALATDGRDVVTRADELRAAQGQQVAELGVRAVVHGPVGLHAEQLAVLGGGHAHGGELGRTLAGVGLLLVPVVVQEDRTAGGQAAAPTRASMVGENL